MAQQTIVNVGYRSTSYRVIGTGTSRILVDIGWPGEILSTPGHSDHCVSLLLDDGSVFTGDLPPEAAAFDNPTALASWQFLRDRGARRVHPAHGPIRSIGPRRETVQ